MSLFQGIRDGTITKPALTSQLGKAEADKIELTRTFLAGRLGREYYAKKLAEFNFSIELLKCLLDKFDDMRLPLKAETKREDKING